MTINEIIELIRDRRDRAKADCEETAKEFGTNNNGFSAQYGAYEELCYLLDDIEEGIRKDE